MTVAYQVRQTLANLQNAQATLEIYAMESQAGESRAVFREAAEAAAMMVSQVAEHLKSLEGAAESETV